MAARGARLPAGACDHCIFYRAAGPGGRFIYDITFQRFRYVLPYLEGTGIWQEHELASFRFAFGGADFERHGSYIGMLGFEVKG
eukprot:COSAG03_NODE_99_length_12968_cov_7.661668_3_plen_84_part_00